jgi:hypothetical protein
MPPKPILFSPELGKRIGDRMARGEPLVSICNDEDMPSLEAAMDWLNQPSDPRFGAIVRGAFDIRLVKRLAECDPMSASGSH